MNKLWANEISRDLGLRWVSDGYSLLHSTQGRMLNDEGFVFLHIKMYIDKF